MKIRTSSMSLKKFATATLNLFDIKVLYYTCQTSSRGYFVNKFTDKSQNIPPLWNKFTSVKRFLNMGLFGGNSRPSQARLDGKTAVVTGANTGIGKATAQDLYTRGARVIVACRNLEKAQSALDDIKEASKDKENLGTILVTELDLSSLKSVRDCTAHLLDNEERIDLLINNAGVFGLKSYTEDGFELTIGTNHLGHFLLTLLLLPKIIQSPAARIVTVSSALHSGKKMDFDDLNWERKKFSSSGAYQQSKLANILFMKELARRLKENNISGVTTYAVHPGLIKTEIFRHSGKNWFAGFMLRMFRVAMKTTEEGAQTIIYCAVDEKCANESGFYYKDCAVKEPSKEARDEEDARKLWEVSWKMVGLPDDYKPFVPS